MYHLRKAVLLTVTRIGTELLTQEVEAWIVGVSTETSDKTNFHVYLK